MKQSSLLVVAFMVAAVIVVAGSVLIGNKLLAHSTALPMCTATGHTLQVRIQNNTLSAPTLTGHRCDTLIITNVDPVTREIGFGAHEHHTAYDGVSERVLRANQSLTINLVETGTFHYHDHFHDEVAGSFTVY